MRQGPNVRCAHAERALPGNPMLPPCPHRPGHPRPVPSDRPAGCDRKGVRVSAGRCMVREHRVTNMHVLPTHMPQYGWAQCHRKGWHVEHRAEHRPRVVDGGYASGGWEPIQSSIYRVSHGPILAVCVGYAQKPQPSLHAAAQADRDTAQNATPRYGSPRAQRVAMCPSSWHSWAGFNNTSPGPERAARRSCFRTLRSSRTNPLCSCPIHWAPLCSLPLEWATQTTVGVEKRCPSSR